MDQKETTVVSQIQTKKKVVFITIDDGGYRPSPADAAAVLKRNRVPATQFLVSGDIAWDKDFYGRVSQRDGQAIQSHMIDHEALATKSAAEQERQICGASSDLKTWFGERPWLMRPPFGAMNGSTRQAAAKCGMDYIVMWSVDTTAQGTFKYGTGNALRSGDIILFHWGPSLDWHLEWALKEIKKQGFTVAALQDYLPRGGMRQEGSAG